MTRVLVCGGRTYNNQAHVNSVLDALHERDVITCIIEGGARGADAAAAKWVASKPIAHETYKDDWHTYGTGAGIRRNRIMLAEGRPDLVVAFPGGAGTRHMLRIARATGVPVMEIGEAGEQ